MAFAGLQEGWQQDACHHEKGLGKAKIVDCGEEERERKPKLLKGIGGIDNGDVLENLRNDFLLPYNQKISVNFCMKNGHPHPHLVNLISQHHTFHIWNHQVQQRREETCVYLKADEEESQ
ncbi:uncharacterized protein ACOB8E_008322 [Sarcophilus harrisii]